MFKHMQYVYLVYQERSFSKAAARLFISQPSLSAMVKKAEEAAGYQIFDRRKHPIALTPFGVEYIRAVEEIYDIQNRLSNYVVNLETLVRGNLSIGGSNFGVSNPVSQAIADFKKTYPNIALDLVELNTLRLIHMLDSGDVDIGITNQPLEQLKYDQILCGQEHIVLAVPEDFPIIAQLNYARRLSWYELHHSIHNVPPEACVKLSDLDTTPFILLRSGNYLRQCTDALFQECGITPKSVMEVEQSSVSHNFASLGLGAILISNTLIEDTAKNKRLAFYKIDSKLTQRNMYLVIKKDCYITFAMRKFMDMLHVSNLTKKNNSINDQRA